jgi:hypothetical protein
VPTVASRKDIHAIDTQLADLHRRHTQCRDLIARCLNEILACETQADELLDQRNAVYR